MKNKQLKVILSAKHLIVKISCEMLMYPKYFRSNQLQNDEKIKTKLYNECRDDDDGGGDRSLSFGNLNDNCF